MHIGQGHIEQSSRKPWPVKCWQDHWNLKNIGNSAVWTCDEENIPYLTSQTTDLKSILGRQLKVNVQTL